MSDNALVFAPIERWAENKTVMHKNGSHQTAKVLVLCISLLLYNIWKQLQVLLDACLHVKLDSFLWSLRGFCLSFALILSDALAPMQAPTLESLWLAYFAFVQDWLLRLKWASTAVMINKGGPLNIGKVAMHASNCLHSIWIIHKPIWKSSLWAHRPQ